MTARSVNIALAVVNDPRVDDAALRIYINLIAAGADKGPVVLSQSDIAAYLTKNGHPIQRQGVNGKLRILELAGYITKSRPNSRLRAYEVKKNEDTP